MCLLVFRYYSWSVAGPMIISALLYQQPLPNECQNNLEKRHALKNKVDLSRKGFGRKLLSYLFVV